jgi:hypothetical protein
MTIYIFNRNHGKDDIRYMSDIYCWTERTYSKNRRELNMCEVHIIHGIYC